MTAERIYTGQLTLGFSEPTLQVYDNRYNTFRLVPDVDVVELPSRESSINSTFDEAMPDDEDRQKHTYAGVYVDSATMGLLITEVLYPNREDKGKGLPQLRGMLNSTPESQTSAYLDKVQRKVDRLNSNAYRLLVPSLEAAGISKDLHLSKVDEIIEEVKARRFSKENQAKDKTQKKIGTTALGNVQ